MMETSARKRIRRAVESRGYNLVSLRWEHWYNAGEKSGIGGGWYGILDRSYQPNSYPSDEIMGLSVEEVIAWIDEFIPVPIPCECVSPPVALLYSTTPTNRHDPDCMWYLKYYLKWWNPE